MGIIETSCPRPWLLLLLINVDLLGLMINSLNLALIEIIRDCFVLLRFHLIFIFIRSLRILPLHPISLILHDLLSFKPLLLYVKFVHLKLLVHVLDLLNLLETQLLMLQTFQGLSQVVIWVILLLDVRGNDQCLVRVVVLVFGSTLVVWEV